MATSKLELAVESGKWESGLRKAQTALNNFTASQGGMQNAIQKNGDKLQDFLRIMQKTESTASTGKARLNDYRNSFDQLTTSYNRLTDAEKRSPFGQELSRTIEVMKGKVQAAKAEVDKMNQSLNASAMQSSQTGGILDQLAGKFGLSGTQALSLAAALGGTTAAMKVAKDAFLATEEGIDTWGRALQAGEGAYNSFLRTINGGNWSNFFNNLSNAISASKELYNALDSLGSIKSNNQAAIAIEQKAIAELRTKYQEAVNAGDKETVKQLQASMKQHEESLTNLRKMEVNAGKNAGITTVKNNIRDAFNTQEGAIPLSDKSADKYAKEIITKGQQAYDKWKDVAENLEKKAASTRNVSRVNERGISSTTTETYTDFSKLTKKEADQLRMARAILSTETANTSGISLYAQAIGTSQQVDQERFRNNRQFGLAGSKSGGSSSSNPTMLPNAGSIDEAEKKLQELNKAFKAASTEAERVQIKLDIDKAREELDKMNGKIKVEPEVGSPADLKAKMAELNKQLEMTADADIRVNIQANIDSLQTQLDAFKPQPIEVGVTIASKQGLDYLRNTFTQKANTTEIGSADNAAAQASIVDVNTFSNVIPLAAQYAPEAAEAFKDAWSSSMAEGIDIPDEAWAGIVEKINEQLASLKLQPITLDVKTGNLKEIGKEAKGTQKDVMGAAQCFTALGNAMNAIEDPGAKTAGLIAQAIGSVVAGYGAASLAAGQQGNPWAWIAFAISGLATMITTVSQIKAISYHADGGFVGMDKFAKGTDTVPAMLTPGELVLNASQQTNLANALVSDGQGYSQSAPQQSIIKGEDIITIVNRTGRRQGRGEILFG